MASINTEFDFFEHRPIEMFVLITIETLATTIALVDQKTWNFL